MYLFQCFLFQAIKIFENALIILIAIFLAVNHLVFLIKNVIVCMNVFKV